MKKFQRIGAVAVIVILLSRMGFSAGSLFGMGGGTKKKGE